MSSKPKKPVPPPLVMRHDTDDGTTYRQPFSEWVFTNLMNYARMAVNEDPAYRVAGQKGLRAVAEALSKEAAEDIFLANINRKNASQPRGKRGPSPKTKLIRRGLNVVIGKHEGITAEGLLDILEADGRMTYDDHDIEIKDAGDSILIRDLRTRAKLQSATVKKASLRQYLKDAREH